MGFFDKLFGKKEKETLNEGLQKTKESFFGKIAKAIVGKSTIDDEVLDNLEEALIGADVGVDTTLAIIEKIQDKVKQQKYSNTTELNSLLQNAIKEILVDVGNDDFKNFKIDAANKPHVILVVGVNGVGKTTTIGKLANNYKKAGYNFIKEAERVTIRPYKHDEFERFLFVAYPYIFGTFSTIIGTFIFVVIYIYQSSGKSKEE